MISVVIPLYNKAPHIAKAINSVLQQTVQPVEIIVVDDGSTDGGKTIVEKYINKNVRYVYQDNQGVSAARNHGIELAKGGYIAFLDADDWWLPNHIEVLENLIHLYPSAKLYSTSYYIQRNNQRYRPRSRYKDGWSGYVQEFFSDYAIGLSLVNSITACSRRDDLLAVGAFPVGVRRGEDIICWINLALSGLVAHVEIPTAVYFHDGVNRSNKMQAIEIPGSILFLSKLIKDKSLTNFQKNGATLLYDRIAFFTAAGYGLDGDKSSVNKIYKHSINLGRYKLAILLRILFITPSWFLRYARNSRHPKIN